MLTGVAAVATSLVVQTVAAPVAHAAADNGKVLVLSTTVTNGTASVEAQEAAADGYGVDLVAPSTWSSMTQAQFGAYKAIILGDPSCAYGTSDITAAANNATTWGPVVTGNVEIVGTDPVFHGKPLVPDRGIDFALSSPAGTTGAYLDLSCYDDSVAANTPVPVLAGLPGSSASGFTLQGVGCADSIHIVAQSAALSGIDDGYLSNWSCSVHEAFDTWPARYGVLAIDTSTGAAYTANDGAHGDPYILAYPGGSVYAPTEELSTNAAEPQTSTNCGPYPVNCATGNFWHTFADLTVPGRGPALALSRTYNSLPAGTDSPFGFGWASSYTMSLSTDSAGAVTVHQENGATVSFTPGSTAGSYTAPPRVFATLANNADGTFTFTRRRREVFTFSATGQLTTVRDLNGETTTLAYDGSGRLTTVTDPAGRTLSFAYGGNGKVASVTDPAGRVVSYRYDAAGDLTGVTDVGGGVSTLATTPATG